jgi:hypothetical protein
MIEEERRRVRSNLDEFRGDKRGKYYENRWTRETTILIIGALGQEGGSEVAPAVSKSSLHFRRKQGLELRPLSVDCHTDSSLALLNPFAASWAREEERRISQICVRAVFAKRSLSPRSHSSVPMPPRAAAPDSPYNGRRVSG